MLPFMNGIACDSYLEKSTIYSLSNSVGRRNYLTVVLANSPSSVLDIINMLLDHYYIIFLYSFF